MDRLRYGLNQELIDKKKILHESTYIVENSSCSSKDSFNASRYSFEHAISWLQNLKTKRLSNASVNSNAQCAFYNTLVILELNNSWVTVLLGNVGFD